MADAEVDAPVRLAALAIALALIATVSGLVVLAPTGPRPVAPAGPAVATAVPAATSAPNNVTGNVSGPSLLGTSSNGTFYFNVTGGPAVEAGFFVGTINWTATLSGGNTTGSSVKPSNGTIRNGTAQPVSMVVTTGPATGDFVLSIAATSALGKSNATANFTKTFRTVVPYRVRATLVAGPNAAILPFNVTVALDGTVIGQVTVPKLERNESYGVLFSYPTTGLSSGYHTFTLTIANPHGLVTFSNGKTIEALSFYVAAPAPNYTWWYVLGVVLFFVVLFIYATRASARRRSPTRR